MIVSYHNRRSPATITRRNRGCQILDFAISIRDLKFAIYDSEHSEDQPQTCRLVSTTNSSFRFWSSSPI
jgi:hypothetical protein